MLERNKTSNAEKIVRIISGIFIVIIVVVLVLIKVANPEFKLGLMVFYIFLVIAFFIGVIIAFHYFKKRGQPTKMDQTADDKLPPAITMEQARELVHKAIQSPTYADYVPNCLGEENELLGEVVKSNVYTYKARGVYQKDLYVIIMNRHFPNELTSILINPTKAEITRAKRLCAKMPEKSPDIEETTTENAFTGTKQSTRKVTHRKDDKTDKKSGDI